jgi:hypothetical protein
MDIWPIQHYARQQRGVRGAQAALGIHLVLGKKRDSARDMQGSERKNS